MTVNFILSAVKRADTSSPVMNANKVNQPARTINGIQTTDLFIRFSSQVVCKGWIHGENREMIFAKCKSAAIACEVPSMGCMVMEAEDKTGAFEFSKDFDDRFQAEEYINHLIRVLL